MDKHTTAKTKKKTGKHERFEPTKLGWAVSAAAASTLALLGVITIYGV